MFGKLKQKAMLALAKKQMKNMPPAQQEMIIKLIENNPDLFKKIGDEIKQKQKEGMNEQYAMIQVMGKYKNELQAIMQG